MKRVKWWLPAVALATVLALASCGGDVEAPDEPAPEALSGTVEIDLSGLAFFPRAVTIEAGSTVVWTNRDALLHTVSDDDDSWDSGDLDQGESYRHTFGVPGSYDYHCEYHAAMVATITVE